MSPSFRAGQSAAAASWAGRSSATASVCRLKRLPIHAADRSVCCTGSGSSRILPAMRSTTLSVISMREMRSLSQDQRPDWGS